MIDLEFIEKLIRTLDESGLDNIDIERGGTRVRIFRSPPLPSAERATEPIDEAADTGSSTASDDGAGVQAEPPEPVDRDREGLLEITSPMVGTFYRAPSPDAESFVDVGSQIAAGDVLCIIEAMKLMNEFEAEAGGVIQEICIGDGEPVEYGQILFRVRPS